MDKNMTPEGDSMKFDPVEQTTEYKAVIDDVMNEIYNAMIDMRLGMYEEDMPFDANPAMADKAREVRELQKQNPAEAYRLIAKLGDCHSIWGMKKRLLREKHGIEWQSPAELNSEILFD